MRVAALRNSTLPSWLELVAPDAHYFLAVRILRLIRMFRILKMVEYVDEASSLVAALNANLGDLKSWLHVD